MLCITIKSSLSWYTTKGLPPCELNYLTVSSTLKSLWVYKFHFISFGKLKLHLGLLKMIGDDILVRLSQSPIDSRRILLYYAIRRAVSSYKTC